MTRSADGEGFSAEERQAMKDRAREVRSRKKKDPETARREGEAEVLAKIAELPDDDRQIAERIHALIGENAPHLIPRTYYGMPGYANEAGKMLCFFQPKSKFKVRYCTLGFETVSNLDDGNVWPTSYAIVKLDDADLAFLAGRVRLAAS